MNRTLKTAFGAVVILLVAKWAVKAIPGLRFAAGWL